MKVVVLCFPPADDRPEREVWELPEGTTVAGLVDAIGAKLPSLAAVLPRMVASVNRELGEKGRVLQDGDEVALMAPLIGG